VGTESLPDAGKIPAIWSSLTSVARPDLGKSFASGSSYMRCFGGSGQQMQNRCVATGFCKRTLIASKVRNANEEGHEVFLGDTCRWQRAAFVDCRLGVYGF